MENVFESGVGVENMAEEGEQKMTALVQVSDGRAST